MNITEAKFHALLMYTGRMPVKEVPNIIHKIRRLITLAYITDDAVLNPKDTLVAWVQTAHHAVDLLYDHPSDRLHYLILMEYVDMLRKRQRAELLSSPNQPYHVHNLLHACKETGHAD